MSSATIMGAGPGMGSALARRFLLEGLTTTVMARRSETLTRIADELRKTGPSLHTVTADVSDENALIEALNQMLVLGGLPELAVYNAGLIQQDNLGDLSSAAQLHAWSVNVVGAVTAAAYLLPRMAERGHGTLLLTGGMPMPVAQYMSLSLGKAGLRALSQMLASEYEPYGVHVATVTIPGAIVPSTALDPDVIADRYWQLHIQPKGAWEVEATIGENSSTSR